MREDRRKVERYWNDNDEMAVLVSPGYGAGWSTWNEPEMAYDKRIIEAYLAGVTQPEIQDFCESIGYPCYPGGWHDVEIRWLKRGTVYKIEEYDGHESIATTDLFDIAEDD